MAEHGAALADARARTVAALAEAASRAARRRLSRAPAWRSTAGTGRRPCRQPARQPRPRRRRRARDAAARTARTSPSPTWPSSSPPRAARPASRRRCCSDWCWPTPIWSRPARGAADPAARRGRRAPRPGRRAALFARLAGRGQVWMTATEPACSTRSVDGQPLPRRGRRDRPAVTGQYPPNPLYIALQHETPCKRRDRSPSFEGSRPASRPSFHSSPFHAGCSTQPRSSRALSRGAAAMHIGFQFDQIYRPRAFAAPPRCARRQELHLADADPGAGDPDRPDRARPARHRPDRHRQDRGLHAAVARPAGANPRVHPIAERVRMLVLAPTRELASQIADSARTYAKTSSHQRRRDLRRHPPMQERPRRRARARRARRHPGPPARPGRPARARSVAASKSSSSTRPTRCSTSASSMR